MATLANVQGSSLVPNIGGLGRAVRGLLPQRTTNQFKPNATAQQITDNLNTVGKVNPKLAALALKALERRDKNQIRKLREAAINTRNEALGYLKIKDPAKQMTALLDRASEKAITGEDPSEELRLADMEQDRRTNELNVDVITGDALLGITKERDEFEPVTDDQGNVVGQRNIATNQVFTDPRAPLKTAPEATFEAVTDDQGNIIGQRNVLTKEVKADPRAAESITAQTDRGKAKQDFDAGLTTRKQFENRIAAINRKEQSQFKLQSKAGKQISDRLLLVDGFGDGSPEVKAFDELNRLQNLPEGAKLSDEAAMRGQYLAQSKEFRLLTGALKKIFAARPDAAGDIAMVFAFMKILDPPSVIREGEQATAANARGVLESVRNTYNRLLRGEKLTPEQRERFRVQASDLVDSQVAEQKRLQQGFTRIANDSGIDPTKIIVFDATLNLPGAKSVPGTAIQRQTQAERSRQVPSFTVRVR